MDIDKQKQTFDSWVDMWDKAQEDGVFDDAPGPHIPSTQTSGESFFGLHNTHPTDRASDADVAAWSDINNTTDTSGHFFGADSPVMPSETGLMQENKKVQEATDRSTSWTDPKKGENPDYPPNPFCVDTGGKDQELKPNQLGMTFDEKDIEELDGIKKKLYELEVKMLTSEVNGKKTDSIETQIENLKNKIDNLSSKMSYAKANKVAGTDN